MLSPPQPQENMLLILTIKTTSASSLFKGCIYSSDVLWSKFIRQPLCYSKRIALTVLSYFSVVVFFFFKTSCSSPACSQEFLVSLHWEKSPFRVPGLHPSIFMLLSTGKSHRSEILPYFWTGSVYCHHSPDTLASLFDLRQGKRGQQLASVTPLLFQQPSTSPQ